MLIKIFAIELGLASLSVIVELIQTLTRVHSLTGDQKPSQSDHMQVETHTHKQNYQEQDVLMQH